MWYLNTDEVHAALFGNGSGQEGLARPRGSVEQQPGALADRQLGEQDRVLEKERSEENRIEYWRKRERRGTAAREHFITIYLLSAGRAWLRP